MIACKFALLNHSYGNLLHNGSDCITWSCAVTARAYVR